MPQSVCPFCGYKPDCCTAVGKHGAPKPGDRTICIACHKWSTFTDRLTLRKPTKKEQEQIDRSPRCRVAEEFLKEQRAKDN